MILLLTGVSCTRSSAPTPLVRLVPPWVAEAPSSWPTSQPLATPEALPTPTASVTPSIPLGTPTPDPLRPTPEIRADAVVHVVRPGDTLNKIAARYSVTSQQILEANHLPNPDILSVGLALVIPPPLPRAPGPSFKIIPDSELVNGPKSAGFDVGAELQRWGGTILTYEEDVEGDLLSGVDIIRMISRRHSVSPRLVIAILEHQTGWVTQAASPDELLPYPLGHVALGWEGLYNQLMWAANTLNAGYYRWKAGWSGPFVLSDGSLVPPGPGINAGTAAVQTMFAELETEEVWRQQVGEDGIYQTYLRLFGNPYGRAVEPLVPSELAQPSLQLPFERDTIWSFTSGPHGAWGSGSAWAALDFAPPGDALGCVRSEAWVVAVADGLVVRAEEGEVILDLDEDGYEQTGWAIFYLHIAERDRVAAGSTIAAGDRIGHPSCEGGISDGTHVHIARKYNGEWIPADGPISFTMDSWVASGLDVEYDGLMTRDNVSLEACGCRAEGNQISR